jgi:oligoendopeptidase F
MSGSAPKWNLSDLYDAIDDPRVEQDLTAVHRRAKEFAAKYRGRVKSPDLTAAELRDALVEHESLSQEAAKPLAFGHLLYSADTGSAEVGAFMQRMEERSTEIGLETIFFGLELLEAEEDNISTLLEDPALADYRHYVRAHRAFREYRLSEPEERVMEEMRTAGSKAFGRLFSETLSNHVFRLEVDGQVREINESQVLDTLRDPDRAVRKAGSAALSTGLAELGRVLVLTFNTLLLEKSINDRLRGHESPQQARHLSNELDDDAVEMVMRVCEEHYPLCAHYYRIKREILGLDELTHYDRYAPLFETETRVEWGEARRIVLDSFGQFSPTVREHAERFFSNGWIDGEVRTGKMGGAFCSYVTPDLHPYVFLNYLGKMDHVLTLAHELGHGVHASLSAEQTYYNYHGTLPLAELASTFGEMLVFDALQERASVMDRLAVYAESIEGSFATIFRQNAMYRFEQDVHKHRREKGELRADELGEYWQRRQQAMFGDSVNLLDEHRSWWSYVPHFVVSPFYVYAYSFGELLVMSLYRMAQEQGPGFAEKYIALLKAGGSRTPYELMSSVGIDLRSREFWVGGFKVLKERIDQFEELWRQYRS